MNRRKSCNRIAGLCLTVSIGAITFGLNAQTNPPGGTPPGGPVDTALFYWPWFTPIIEGRLYRESSFPEVYLIYGGRKIHVPTESALISMGYSWSNVQVVPNDTLRNYPRFNIPSGSPTPSSLVYPPDHKKWFPLAINSTRALSRNKEIQISELYGWIRGHGCGDGSDYHYSFEVDTEWALSKGIDLNRLWRVGNIAWTGDRLPGFSARRAVARPIIAIELNEWARAEGDGRPQPHDWSAQSPCPPNDRQVRIYPFSPTGLNLDTDQGGGRLAYVRVSGSLVTDSPHDVQHRPGTFFSRWFAITFSDGAEWEGSVPDWHPGKDSGHPDHYARWTEIHPPDLIEVLPMKHPKETIRGVALAARVGALPFGLSNSCEAVDFTLAPEADRPDDSIVAYEEHRGPEVFFPWGENRDNGSWVTVYEGHVRIRARVCGGALFGSPGRFKALYRVWWTPRPKAAPPSYGSVFRLRHVATGCRLHSHLGNYGHSGTSGQQQVTCFAGRDDNDDWIVRGPNGTSATYNAGQPIRHGDIVRLQHRLTGRNLHSHFGFPSPVTRQQEVTCFGQNGSGDGGDNWRVELLGASVLEDGVRLRLVHLDSNHALHSHQGWSHPQWTSGQQEVTGFAGRDDNDLWTLNP